MSDIKNLKRDLLYDKPKYNVWTVLEFNNLMTYTPVGI